MLAPPASLLSLSAALGANPAWVQGAGGNTSVKADGVIWVKASGALLAEAEVTPMFLPLDLARAGAVLAAGGNAQDAVLGDGAGLRPSIETALHVAFPHAVVAHTHCVNAIAYAARADAKAALAEKLAGLNWAFAPYARPGAPLADAVAAACAGAAPDILILASHGLVVGGPDADAVMALQKDVDTRLARSALPSATPDIATLEQACSGTDWGLPLFAEIHALAFAPARDKACAGALYPDHVVFLGPGPVPVIAADRLAAFLAHATEKFPAMVVVPGAGALVRKDATKGVHEMARCLALVAAQADPAADYVYLTPAQEQELLNWDAETYRQALERARG